MKKIILLISILTLALGINCQVIGIEQVDISNSNLDIQQPDEPSLVLKTPKKDIPNLELRPVMQVKHDYDNASLKEKHAVNKRVKTAEDKQADLAKKINTETTLTEEVVTSSKAKIIKGQVVENVLVSIDDCVKLGLFNNPTIRYAVSNSSIYKSRIAQAWQDYFPKIGIYTGYSRNRFLSTSFSIPNPNYNLWYAANIEASQMIFDFGKTNAKVNIAKKSHEASLNELQNAINTTIYNVKSSYYNYLYCLRQRQVLKSTVDKYEKHYNEAKAGYELGARAKIDVVTAEYNLSNAKLELIKAKHQTESAKAALNDAMGLPSYAGYNVTDKMELQDYNLDLDNLMKTAFDVRPELLSTLNKAEASKIMIKSSKLAFAPDVKAFGNYSLGGNTYAKDYGYQFGVKLEYPITNFILLKHQVTEAKYTHERDMAELDEKRNSVFLDVKTAYIDYLNAKDSVPVAHKAMNEAKLQYEIAAGRYKTGLSDAVELKDAETTYKNAQLNYFKSLMEYNNSVAYLEKVVGTPITTGTSTGEISAPIDVNL